MTEKKEAPIAGAGENAGRKVRTTARASTALPDWLTARLANPPQHGEGVHSWLFGISRQLWAHHGESEQVAMLAQATANCGRKVPLREIVSAVRVAAGCAWRPKMEPIGYRFPTVGNLGKVTAYMNTCTPSPTWPTRNQERIEALERETLERIWRGAA